MGIVLERTEPGPLGETYKHPTINEFYIAAHAKPRCSRCRGKGKLSFDNPTTGIKWSEACDCLFRK